jgi:hypothetical protein
VFGVLVLADESMVFGGTLKQVSVR